MIKYIYKINSALFFNIIYIRYLNKLLKIIVKAIILKLTIKFDTILRNNI